VTDFASPSNVIEFWEEIKQTGKYPDYDLILTDNRMPGMTGLEFLAKAKELAGGVSGQRRTSRAVISGSWTDSERKQAQELGCQTFSKPVPIDDIYDWIEEQDSQRFKG